MLLKKKKHKKETKKQKQAIQLDKRYCSPKDKGNINKIN